MNFIDLKNTIHSGSFDILIGILEDEHFEAKSGKYDFSSDHGKQELAKDISSFTNRSGGIIVIGAKTTDDPSFFGRRVDSISPFSVNLINPTDYHNVIKDWIYPRPENIEIEWIPSKTDSDLGLLYIFIPDQPENIRPFLLKKEIDPQTGRKRKEILFGYVERLSHSSDPVSVSSFHSMIRQGRENRWKEDLDNRLAAIEGKLSESPEDKERKKNFNQLALTRIEKAIDAAGLKEHRTYSLAISPFELTQVRSILSSSAGSISNLLEKPPQLRDGGWGMDTEDRARIIGGELRRVKSDEYKIVDLYRDGTLIFSCRADESLLCWGQDYRHKRINPLALIETTYLFFNLYSKILEWFDPPVKELRLWIQFKNLHSNGEISSLAPFGVGSTAQLFGHNRKLAPDNSFLNELSVTASEFNDTVTAVSALREIYAWFGIEADKIPYLVEDRTAIDINKIMNPR